jgi:integrase
LLVVAGAAARKPARWIRRPGARGETRRVKISPDLSRRIVEHIEDHELGPDDLLFWFQDLTEPDASSRAVANSDELDLTEPNAAGRRYRHGTTSGYNAGKCKSRPCRDAIATYRAAKRAASGAAPRRRRRRTDEDGHISRDWFRQQVWKKALKAAAIGIHVRPHDLRHAHASWLLAGGADLQQVKEHLGHGSIATSERYLHTLPDADESVLDAFTSIRHRTPAADLPRPRSVHPARALGQDARAGERRQWCVPLILVM